MEVLSQQWPMLAAVMALFTPLFIFISRLYERMIDKAEEREREAIEIAKETSRVIEQLTRRLEEYMGRERGVR